MPQNDTVLLIGATDHAVRRAHALGARVLLVQRHDRLTDVQRELTDAAAVGDYHDWADCSEAVMSLHASHGFAAAVSFCSRGLETAARINELLSLPGTRPGVLSRMRDRWLLHRSLVDAALPGPRGALWERRSDLDAFAALHGFPCLVGPRACDHELDWVGGPEEATEVWARLTALSPAGDEVPSAVITEPVGGPEFRVVSFSFQGRHVVAAIVETPLTDDGRDITGYLAPARLNDRDEQEIRRAATLFLDAVGFADGLCHTSVRLTPRGGVVVEGQLGRDRQVTTELAGAVCGVDLVSYELGWPLGLVEPPAGDWTVRGPARTLRVPVQERIRNAR